MRVSTRQQFAIYNRQIQQNSSELASAQRRVSTGLRFEHTRENLVDGLYVVSTNSLRNRIEQYTSNLRSAKEYLGLSEQAMADIGDSLKRSYTLAIQGATSAVDQAGRTAMADEIQALQEKLVTIGNTQGTHQQYIFAGDKTSTKPFSVAGGALVFAGDTDAVRVETAPGDTMRVNVENADTFFSGIYNTLETLKNHLRSGDISALSSTDVAAVQQQLDLVHSVRGDIGVKVARVSELEAANGRRIDALKEQASDAQGVDLAEAMLEMTHAEAAYEASLRVASRGFALSLMDFMQ